MEVLPQPAKERRERLAYALPRSMPRLLRHRYDTPLSVLRGPVQHRQRHGRRPDLPNPHRPQTIFAAVADTLCAAREQGLWAHNYWSLSESWTLGFVDPSNLTPSTANFPAYSISCVTFPNGGSAPTILRYSGTEASSGTGPVQVQ